MKFKISLLLLVPYFFLSCQEKTSEEVKSQPEPPVAKKVAEEMKMHGDTRIDNYSWMRLSDEQKNSETPDQQTSDVIGYLEAENDYLDAEMKDVENLKDSIYTEIVSRFKENDESVPVRENGYDYYSRYTKGADYPVVLRKKVDGGEEQIIFNGPEMAKGYKYYGIGNRSVSTDNKLMLYAIDTVSRRRYDIYIKNLENDSLLTDRISNTTGSGVWANDNKTFFYVKKDPVTLRADKVYKHVLGTEQSQDVEVYDEKDDTFSTFVYKSKSDDYIIIGSSQTLSSEFRYLSADKPDGEFKVIQPREKNLEYSVDHMGNDFYIRTNLNAKNFKLVKAPVNSPTKANWKDVIPHRDSIYLQDFDLFKDYLVLTERKEGLKEVRVKSWNNDTDYYLDFNDPSYQVYTNGNMDFDTDILRYNYTSLTTPMSTFEYNMKTKEQTLLKQDEVLDDDFKPENFISERIFATATDGTKIPVSIVYKKGTEKNGRNPLLLYAYGSYGSNQEASFRSENLSLIEQGFIYAIAHIRGGQEMGRDWYENGKLLKKKNTFTDFINVGEFLIDEGFTSSDHLYAYGGSAGGLLMGAILNMKPEIFNGVVAAVPFVDVVSTMLDETIPLTTFEFDEWGNPMDKEYYDYMKSYSPYDNVEAKDYPNILVTTGYWDSQVQYWEPAKWVAKLRELKTDDNLLLLDTDMDVGHGGASGRFERYKRTALVFAFLLKLEEESKMKGS
ncbi:oligopeptidase B [Flavobacteriaceae bacterium MAR_2010_188]|nr:oligopeptidase B [Flavobacteriaceae bacterium MAR_2010_188]